MTDSLSVLAATWSQLLASNGGAEIGKGSPATLQLTDGGGSESNAVWTAAPVNVQSFTTDFSFQISGGTNTADGFTFTLQNAAPNALGAVGGGLGYQGIGSSVAIKFDLYSNSGEGVDSTGFFIDGASPTVPSLDMTAAGDFVADEFGRDDRAIIETRAKGDAGMLMAQIRLCNFRGGMLLFAA